MELFWRELDGMPASIAEVGGKAATLIRLMGLGAPVPPGATLTTAAYRAFVEAAGLRPFLESLPSLPNSTDPEEQGREVEEAFLGAPIPEKVRRAIHDAFAYASYRGPVAVRSSATAEDLSQASFAGQYLTLLGVGLGGVEDAVRRCWASLWSPAVRAYKHALGIRLGPDIAMGVVIQRMVPAEWSGVLFTVDPTGTAEGMLRVEAVEGLGERLVSGEVSPEVFHIWRDDHRVVGRGPEYLPELARWGVLIEQALGGPQDIEWSLAGGLVHILQARPITAGLPVGGTGDGFDSVPTNEAEYTPSGVSEMLPGALTPPRVDDQRPTAGGGVRHSLPKAWDPPAG